MRVVRRLVVVEVLRLEPLELPAATPRSAHLFLLVVVVVARAELTALFRSAAVAVDLRQLEPRAPERPLWLEEALAHLQLLRWVEQVVRVRLPHPVVRLNTEVEAVLVHLQHLEVTLVGLPCMERLEEVAVEGSPQPMLESMVRRGEAVVHTLQVVVARRVLVSMDKTGLQVVPHRLASYAVLVVVVRPDTRVQREVWVALVVFPVEVEVVEPVEHLSVDVVAMALTDNAT